MGWDGAGGYNRQHNFSADASVGINILAARMDTEFNDVASAITLAWARNGQNVPTQAVPMGGQRFINVGAATSIGNYMRVREFIENVPVFMVDAESSTDRISVSAQYFTSVSANQAPGDGTRIFVRAGSNKSSAALYLNGHSANVEYQDGNRIGPAVISGGLYEFLYSSADAAWKIQNPDDGRTSAETAATVNPTHFQKPPLDVNRYGTNTTPGTTDMQPAIDAAESVAYRGFTDGTNYSISIPTGSYGVNAQTVINYGVRVLGEGERSTRLVALSDFSGLNSTGMVRLGNGSQVSFGTELLDVMLECSTIAGSMGVFSSDLQSGGCFNVTVNNFLGTGFSFDPDGTVFGSINGLKLQQCQSFKANSGGTGGTAFNFEDGTFFISLDLCQAFGNPSNPLATGYSVNNIPLTMVACNVDGAATEGIDFATAGQGVIVGFTSNGATTAINIDTALQVTVLGLYMPSGTSSIVDAGNGGGKAKTLTQDQVPLYWRGSDYAHGDFLKIWGTLEVVDLNVNGGIRYGKSATTPDISDGGTVATAGVTVSRYTPAGNRTGLILAAGTEAGQMVTVLNQSANTMTFAAAGTSNVADGTSMVIAALKGATFIWDDSSARWYHCA